VFLGGGALFERVVAPFVDKGLGGELGHSQLHVKDRVNS
jgi:hypothetical protein